MREKIEAALDWLRGFLESMMGAQAYDEAAFRRQIRDLTKSPRKASGSRDPTDGERTAPQNRNQEGRQ